MVAVEVYRGTAVEGECCERRTVEDISGATTVAIRNAHIAVASGHGVAVDGCIRTCGYGYPSRWLVEKVTVLNAADATLFQLNTTLSAYKLAIIHVAIRSSDIVDPAKTIRECTVTDSDILRWRERDDSMVGILEGT